MAESDLFSVEAGALARAEAALEQADLAPHALRPALCDLSMHYGRLMREMRRLIARSDRTELELNAVNAMLKKLGAELEHKARHDHLTGALNRGAVFERADHYLRSEALALIVLDIDFFKRINDSFGHPAGDAVIRELIARLKHALGGDGEVGRVGGEEFTVLLPGAQRDAAIAMAEAIRAAIAGRPFDCLPQHPVTASFGIACSSAGVDFEQTYARADAALYRAKNGGRNRVEFEP